MVTDLLKVLTDVGQRALTISACPGNSPVQFINQLHVDFRKIVDEV
jgi:hypothetical protein